jgi:hypothetical protein
MGSATVPYSVMMLSSAWFSVTSVLAAGECDNFEMRQCRDWYNLKCGRRLLFGLLHNDDRSVVHLRKRALLNRMVDQLEFRGTPLT